MNLCDRCKLLGREVEATHLWVSPCTLVEGRPKRFEQRLCRACWDYDRERSSLSNQSFSTANKKFGKECPKPATEDEHITWTSKWNSLYHKTTDRLWRERCGTS